MHRLLLVFGCVLSSLTNGCSSTDASSASSGGSIELAQLPERFATTLCEALGPCCSAGQIAFDSALCHDQARDDFALLVASNTGSAYDARAAGACLSTLTAQIQGCSAIDDVTFARACGKVFTGALPAGAECDNSGACASHSCIYDFTKKAGLCSELNTSVPQHGAAGDECVGECSPGSDGNETCLGGGATQPGLPFTYCYTSDGVYCSVGSGSPRVCTDLVPVGGACDPDPCAAGSFCNRGVCTAQSDAGACFGSSPLSDSCSIRAYCSSTNTGNAGECVPRKADGKPCAFAFECSSSKCTVNELGSGACGTGPAATPQICGGRFMGNLD